MCNSDHLILNELFFKTPHLRFVVQILKHTPKNSNDTIGLMFFQAASGATDNIMCPAWRVNRTRCVKSTEGLFHAQSTL